LCVDLLCGLSTQCVLVCVFLCVNTVHVYLFDNVKTGVCIQVFLGFFLQRISLYMFFSQHNSKYPLHLAPKLDHEIDKQASYLAKQVGPINIGISTVQVHR